jgi:hypothetical protein
LLYRSLFTVFMVLVPYSPVQDFSAPHSTSFSAAHSMTRPR